MEQMTLPFDIQQKQNYTVPALLLMKNETLHDTMRVVPCVRLYAAGKGLQLDVYTGC